MHIERKIVVDVVDVVRDIAFVTATLFLHCHFIEYGRYD